MKKFVLKFIWFEKYIAVSLDQKIGGKTVPLTEYFFWPRVDAWEDIRVNLQLKPWILESDSISVLNQLTEVINFWQERNEVNRKKDLQLAKEKFINCLFVGHD